ncbi:MAG TPA: DPP IV N-terminal domain-containing protein [Candidatus Aquilonibacter sp.]
MRLLLALLVLSVTYVGCGQTAGTPAHEQAGALTVDDIVAVHPVTGTPPRSFSWSPDGSHYAYQVAGARENDPPTLFVYDMRTNRETKLIPAKSEARGTRSRAIAEIAWSNDGSHIAFLNAGALHVARADGSDDHVIDREADAPQWSPDGTRIAYVRDNDLYVSAVGAGAKPQRLTFDGSKTRFNGDPDWLYSEEMNVEEAFHWSPDGASIAYLSFDESPITPFPIQDYLVTPVNTVEEQFYPLAGAKNPRVSLHVVDTRSAASRLLYDGGPKDEYVISFTWTPDSSAVVDEIVDRPQRHLRLESFPRASGAPRVLLSESDAHFVDTVPPPLFARDGRSYFWLSPRAGVQALYRIDYASGRAQRLTGNYAVTSVQRIDERNGVAYVSALYPTRRDESLLAIPLQGGQPRDITPGAGSHLVVMPERSGNSFIETFSSVSVPTTILRRSLDGSSEATLFQTPNLSKYDLATTRLIQIPSRWGPLDALLTVPSDFDSSKKYPVVVTAYGGPLGVTRGTAANAWQGLLPTLLAQHGFLSFSVDGPASNNDRAANPRMFSSSMGLIAMAGQLAGVAWLKNQPFVDAKHLGLFGWSYGGYLTAFTLTHAPDVFASGVAGAPPADWHFYDTAYTERYMGMPQTNAAAYDRTSVLPAADKLKAHLLILQGTSDDNVHLMNSISLLNAFINAGKHVDYFVYPGARHGPTKISQRRNIDARMLRWWESTLK